LKDERTVVAQAGISLSKLAAFLAEQELTGFEFAFGIPGTLGGAAVMNAGAYGSEMKNCVDSVFVLNTKTMESFEMSKQELQYSYRHSRLQDDAYVVLTVTLSFQKGKKEDILAFMGELNQKRRKKQPLEYPSAGSTFKRPEGHFAGKLISDAGMRGYRIGDAQVSEKHCGFVINRGKATGNEVLQVIRDVQKAVKANSGIDLVPEVRIIEGCDGS
jgi:UDP-N-acetylmuramate dehydrogenase